MWKEQLMEIVRPEIDEIVRQERAEADSRLREDRAATVVMLRGLQLGNDQIKDQMMRAYHLWQVRGKRR